MDLKQLKRIIDLVKKSGIAEIEISEGQDKVRVSNQQNNKDNIDMVHHYNPPPVIHENLNKVSTEKNSNKTPDNKIIKSPMVGTFYRSSSPGSKAFVEVGQKIKEGDTLCIIEAMKLMNEIESDKSGTIVEILVNNSTPVEFGEPLFIIE